MLRSKRGQGLPLTTIIIAILVIVVLIVLVTFFFSGSTTLTNSIKRIFYGTTAGTDLALATENCRFYCQQIESLPESQIQSSAYCKKYFLIDQNNDGEADYTAKDIDGKETKIYDRWYCNIQETDLATGGKLRTLGVPCTVATQVGGQAITCNQPQ